MLLRIKIRFGEKSVNKQDCWKKEYYVKGQVDLSGTKLANTCHVIFQSTKNPKRVHHLTLRSQVIFIFPSDMNVKKNN